MLEIDCFIRIAFLVRREANSSFQAPRTISSQFPKVTNIIEDIALVVEDSILELDVINLLFQFS